MKLHGLLCLLDLLVRGMIEPSWPDLFSIRHTYRASVAKVLVEFRQPKEVVQNLFICVDRNGISIPGRQIMHPR